MWMFLLKLYVLGVLVRVLGLLVSRRYGFRFEWFLSGVAMPVWLYPLTWPLEDAVVILALLTGQYRVRVTY